MTRKKSIYLVFIIIFFVTPFAFFVPLHHLRGAHSSLAKQTSLARWGKLHLPSKHHLPVRANFTCRANITCPQGQTSLKKQRVAKDYSLFFVVHRLKTRLNFRVLQAIRFLLYRLHCRRFSYGRRTDKSN